MKMRIIQLAVFLLALAALIAGVGQGDYQDTLQKAIRICLECVGIG